MTRGACQGHKKTRWRQEAYIWKYAHCSWPVCSVPRLTLTARQPFPLPYKQSHYEDACRPKLRNANGSRKWSHSKKKHVENTFGSIEPRLREERKHALREISNNLNLNLQGYYLNFWNSESHLNNLIILISYLRVPQFIFFKKKNQPWLQTLMTPWTVCQRLTIYANQSYQEVSFECRRFL